MIRVMKITNIINIQQKVVISIAILIILPMVVSGYFSYRSSSKIINRKTSQYFYQAMSQTSENYRTILNEVENISYIILANESVRNLLNSSAVDTDYVQSYNQVNLLIRNLLAKPYIYSVCISNKGNVVYQSGAAVTAVDENKWYQEAEKKKGKIVWSSIFGLEHQLNKDSQKVISLYRQIIDIDRNVPIGVLRISISEDMLFKVQKNLATESNPIFFLVDGDGIILSHENKEKLGMKFDYSEIIHRFNGEEVFYNGKIDNKLYYYAHKVEGYNYYLIGILPSWEISYETKPIRNIIIFTLIGCVIFGVCFAHIMYVSITKPIRNLISKMDEVEKGNFDVVVFSNSENEIGGLFHHFNSMISKIKLLIRDLYEVRLKEREAELKSLQEQINPHFLYNTLDTIRWTARRNHDFEVDEYIEILSSILRHNLNNGHWETNIGQEIAHLSDYTYLQKKRYGDKLNVNISIDYEIYSYKIIKLVLQPIVENSIKYGFDARFGQGNITVEGKKNGENIEIEIIDDGVGNDENKINQIINSKAETKRIYALKNINERIKLHYGNEYGVNFISSKHKGAKVRILIPAIQDDMYLDDI